MGREDICLTSPGGRPSLSGAWVLDTSRSDTLEEYLRCLGASEATIHAQAVAEEAYPSRNVIALEKSRLTVYKKTASNSFTEGFEFDEERVIESKRGSVIRSVASLGESGQLDGFNLTSMMQSAGGRGSLVHVEIRELCPGGHVHTQELSVRNLVTGTHSVTIRSWVRVPVTELDLVRLCPPPSG